MKRQYNIGYIPSTSDKYLDDVKQALIDKGLADEDTPNSELDESIKNIELPESFSNINLDNKQKFITKNVISFYICSNNVDCYCLLSSDGYAIYHLNLLTGETNKLITPTQAFNYFFETSSGVIFVGSYRGTGIYKLTPTSAKQIYNKYSAWQYFFEDSKGNVYASGGDTSSSNNGLLFINGDECLDIYPSTCLWKYFFEDSKGNVYASSSSSTKGVGLLYLNGSEAPVKIYETGYNWKYFFEDSKGNVYAEGGKDLLLNGSETPQQITVNLEFIFEDSKGNVYGGSSASGSGITLLNGKDSKRIYTSGYNWQYFFEDSKGNVYVSCPTSTKGIVRINGKNAVQIYTSGYNWKYFFEDSKGNVYVSGSDTSDGGILYLNEPSLLFNMYKDFQYFTENPKGVIVSKTKIPDGQDFLLIDENQNVYLVKE